MAQRTLKNPYLLTFVGGAMATTRYRRWHPTFDGAREEALRVLAIIDNRAAHPDLSQPIIGSPPALAR
jgi:hypothetical protein